MNLLFLTFLFPLLGWFVLSFSRGRLSENASAVIGVGSVGLSALTAAWVIGSSTCRRRQAVSTPRCSGSG